MGLMVAPGDAGQLVLTPHPVTLDGQRHIPMDLQPGERLCSFLHRHVPGLDDGEWVVSIGGRVVPRAMWAHVYPKDRQVIEVRGAVANNALRIIAYAALIYFTWGYGATTAGMWGAGAVAGTYGALAATAVYVAGSMLINKVLGPKLEKPGDATAGTVYSLAASRNRQRLYEPLGLLFGRVRIAPDIASKPYSYYEGDDQYLVMRLTPGIGVGRVENYYNGDTLLTSYEGVSVYHRGYTAMPDQALPGYSNADTIDGGELLDTSHDPKGKPGAWVQRTTSVGTIRVMVNIDYLLFDTTSKGKPKDNSESIQVQYCPTGTGSWVPLPDRSVTNSTQAPKRATIAADLPEGQYDVRVRVAGRNTDGSGATARFTWSTLTSVQGDKASYAGIAQTVAVLKATGQLNGTPDELRAVHIAAAIPVWRNGAWVTEETSNPGAHILKYARGYYDEEGVRIAGMGKGDEEIDIEALKGFMAHCEANGYTYDYWLTEERSHDEVLDAIALAGMGQKSWATGRLSIAWAADGQPLSGVVNMATMKKGSFSVDYTLANAADGVEYSYFDSTTQKVETLRVPAPGVQTMLNPARLTGEGVSREAHAAEMARYHLAQSLYQYKDIGFAQDLEYLSYRRLSRLAISHDLTQWGFGGRVVAAQRAGGAVTLTLDEPVPPMPSGSSFVGLRIPGEAVYRVFRVQRFPAATDQITLDDAWPADAPLPGEGYQDGADWQPNPAHDTIWIYDFKATPGYSVRVVSIEPESDLRGATIAVVPEGPEFWHYVKTGAYQPPAGGSSLETRPIISGLSIAEDQVTAGDVTSTDLVATFEVTGPFDHAVVYAAAAGGSGELVEVAQTSTRTARWRIAGAGTFTVNVRPFGPDGQMGVGSSLIYTTSGADAPPVNYDIFRIEEISGGIRRYNWGYFTDTIQSANLAGAEIRYAQAPAQGEPSPAWEAMTPVGDSGYHTGAFDSPIPASGTWIFAIRARNTNGTLSLAAKYITATLGKNTGELFTEQQAATSAANLAITKEIQDRLNADAAAIQAAAADASAKANAAREAAIAHADVIGAQVADIIGADEWATAKDYPKGDLVKHNGTLYRALRDNSSVEPGATGSDNDWQAVGNYDSLGEAVAAAVSLSTTNASDIAVQAQQLDAVQVRMPTGTGTLATEALVVTEQQARADADTALGLRTQSVEARMPTGADTLANEARVVRAEQASVSRDNALGQRVDAVSAKLPADGGQAASVASVTAYDQASVSRDNALGQRVDSVQASIGLENPNLLTNPTFANGMSSWFGDTAALQATAELQYGPYAYFVATGNGVNKGIYQEYANPKIGGTYWFGADVYRNNSAGVVRVELTAYNGTTLLSTSSFSSDTSKVGVWQRNLVSLQIPSGATRLVASLIANSTTANNSVRRAKLEISGSATSYGDDVGLSATASAVTNLQANVATLNGQMTANAQAITSVNARMVSNPNLLPNGGFENGITGWNQLNGLVVNAGTNAGWGRILGGSAPSAQTSDVYSDRIAVSAGITYTFSGDAVFIASTNAAYLTFDILWYDANDNNTGVAFGPAHNAAFDFDVNNAARSQYKATGVAPANTTSARVRMRWYNNGTTIQAVGFRQMKLERGSNATEYTADSVISQTASAAQSLSVNLNALTGQVNSKYTLALSVNGYVSGITSVNNGTTSTFDVVADTFRIVAPTGGERLEYSGNNLRVYDGNGVLIVRIGRW
ncbi:host specificity factor TipJ family phage tail protein [Xanthomonas sacchari]|uniref:host specificity factor TipJ family phage tail protein n=1 Tax=Xanthomonas sacchari TaxID=56458 RepID=UPI00225DFC74|nr:host specificity factor TipJ family phage tail protein [Xanthomonas sacchari]UYK82320.1 host specificity factor TipJ family phage tail protein [Xanthomonas sacchari]